MMGPMQDGVLLLTTDADTGQRLACATVRADQRLIVIPGNRRMFGVHLPALWAGAGSDILVMLHGPAPLPA